MLSRALIVLLIVLNAGVALWWVTRSDSPVPSAPEAPTGVARLQLLSEVAPTALPPPPVSTPMAPGTPITPSASADITAVPIASRCLAFGPFVEAGALAAARAALRPLATTLRTREVRAPGARGWQVILPPLGDAVAAEAMAERIKAAGITDYFVMREGDDANGIALGRYGSEGSARQREATLRAAGFAAQAQPLGGTVRTWIEIAVADASFDAARARTAAGADQANPVDCAGLR